MFTLGAATHAASRGPADVLPIGLHDRLRELDDLRMSAEETLLTTVITTTTTTTVDTAQLLGALTTLTRDLTIAVDKHLDNLFAGHDESVATVVERFVDVVLAPMARDTPPPMPTTEAERAYVRGEETFVDIQTLVRALPDDFWNGVDVAYAPGDVGARVRAFYSGETQQHVGAPAPPPQRRQRRSITAEVTPIEAMHLGLVDNFFRMLAEADDPVHGRLVERELARMWSLAVNVLLFGSVFGPMLSGALTWTFMPRTRVEAEATRALEGELLNVRAVEATPRLIHLLNEEGRLTVTDRNLLTLLRGTEVELREAGTDPAVVAALQEFIAHLQRENERLQPLIPVGPPRTLWESPELLAAAVEKFGRDRAGAIDTMRIQALAADPHRRPHAAAQTFYATARTDSLWTRFWWFARADWTGGGGDVPVLSSSVLENGHLAPAHYLHGETWTIGKAWLLAQLQWMLIQYQLQLLELGAAGRAWQWPEIRALFVQFIVSSVITVTLVTVLSVLWEYTREPIGDYVREHAPTLGRAVTWLRDVLPARLGLARAPFTFDEARDLDVLERVGAPIRARRRVATTAFQAAWTFGDVMVRRGVTGIMGDMVHNRVWLAAREIVLLSVVGVAQVALNRVAAPPLSPYEPSFRAYLPVSAVGLGAFTWLALSHYYGSTRGIDPERGRAARRVLMGATLAATLQATLDFGLARDAATTLTWVHGGMAFLAVTRVFDPPVPEPSADEQEQERQRRRRRRSPRLLGR